MAAVLFLSLAWANSASAAQMSKVTNAKLHHIIGKLEKAGAQVGVEITDLGSVKNAQQFPAKSTFAPKVLFSHRAKQRYMSASNWKLFTAFFALSSGVPDSARDTKLYYFGSGKSDKKNLVIMGHGDPSLNIAQLHKAALALKAQGIREITGDVLGDGAAFGAETLGGRYPFGWTLDDALWYYAPPISALAINRNQADIYITGGNKPGDPAKVTYSPALPNLEMRAHVTTGNTSLKNKSVDQLLHWDRFEEGERGFTLTGKVAPNQKLTQGIALADPQLMAAKVLLHELQKVGIKVDGKAGKSTFRELPPSAVLPRPNYTIPAPSLKVLLTRMLKRSDNFYAEMVLRSGAWHQSFPQIQSAMFDLLQKNGINTSGLRMEDGSGLSRYTLITPQAMVQLLNAAQQLPASKGSIFWNALPIAGKDGTLRYRMKSTFAQNNVRAKTGTFSTACNLSGYVTTRDGHRLAVSFLINFGPKTSICRAAQNSFFETLAAMKMK